MKVGEWKDTALFLSLCIIFWVKDRDNYCCGLDVECLPKTHMLKVWSPGWGYWEVVESLGDGSHWVIGVYSWKVVLHKDCWKKISLTPFSALSLLMICGCNCSFATPMHSHHCHLPFTQEWPLPSWTHAVWTLKFQNHELNKPFFINSLSQVCHYSDEKLANNSY
jgi:hypothetical protein